MIPLIQSLCLQDDCNIGIDAELFTEEQFHHANWRWGQTVWKEDELYDSYLSYLVTKSFIEGATIALAMNIDLENQCLGEFLDDVMGILDPKIIQLLTMYGEFYHVFHYFPRVFVCLPQEKEPQIDEESAKDNRVIVEFTPEKAVIRRYKEEL